MKRWIAALSLIAGLSQAKDVQVDELKLKIPDTWTQEQVRSSMRKAQFKIPAPDGKADQTGELVIFHFGVRGGGPVKANIDRWIGQFEKDGRKVSQEDGESTNGKYSLVSIIGTYNKPFGPPFAQQTKPAPGYQMLGAIINTPNKGNYFLKFTGPEKTVTAAEKDFKAAIGVK
ncbi:MAG: hypothetical protein AAF492_12205 [Verrucomicrobiota bacterium]